MIIRLVGKGVAAGCPRVCHPQGLIIIISVGLLTYTQLFTWICLGWRIDACIPKYIGLHDDAMMIPQPSPLYLSMPPPLSCYPYPLSLSSIPLSIPAPLPLSILAYPFHYTPTPLSILGPLTSLSHAKIVHYWAPAGFQISTPAGSAPGTRPAPGSQPGRCI